MVCRRTACMFFVCMCLQLAISELEDLAQARSLSVSEKRLLRLGLSQLSFGAVKTSGLMEIEASKNGQDWIERYANMA